MTRHEVVAEGLSAPGPVLWASVGVLLVLLCVLAWLLVRALRARHQRIHTSPTRGNGDRTVAEVLAVIADAQQVLHTTADELEDNRQRLERLRLEAEVRRHGGAR